MIATHFHFCLKSGNYSALLILMRLRLAAMKALNSYEIYLQIRASPLYYDNVF